MGRTGNNLFQYLFAYIFAKKFNLLFIYSNIFGDFFNEKHIYGEKCTDIFYVTDDNFLELITKNNIDCKNYIMNGFFQNKFVVDEIVKIKDEFFNLNYNTKDDIFLHYRIGDINNTKCMLPIYYYKEAIEYFGNKNKIYISSDSPNHQNVRELIKNYDCELINESPIETIKFAKNFTKIILSEGTFSWWIGFLSKNSEVVCNKRKYKWHGDIFLDNWHKLNYE
jgi:hypothetical protein